MEDQDDEQDYSPQRSNQDPMNLIEDLIFELKVEKLKNEKLKLEWQNRKSQYESQIEEVRLESSLKSHLLDRMSKELNQVRDKFQDICGAYQVLEQQSDDLKIKLSQSQTLITSIESNLTNLKSKDEEKKAKLTIQNDVISQSFQAIKQLQNCIQKGIQTQSLIFNKKLDSVTQRILISDSKLKKMRLYVQKLQVERAFFKEKLRHQKLASISKQQKISMSNSLDETIDDELFTLKNSVCMFREESDQLTGVKLHEELVEKENLPRMVTFGQVKYITDDQGTTEALDEARTIIKYKSDKEFLSKVFDAQLRVSKFEQKLNKKPQTSGIKFDFGQLGKKR